VSFYIIRHLPTPWNLEKKLQGSKDISITTPDKKTLEKIQQNLQEFKALDFDHILVSQLKRTLETAAHYGYLNVEVEPLINELNFGKFEGESKTKMLSEVGDNWYKDATKVSLGETLLNFEQRLKLFNKKYENKDVLVFAHGAVTRALVALSEKNTIKEMNTIDIPNNSLTVIF
jgi:broad specificity phosphatase PhoE